MVREPVNCQDYTLMQHLNSMMPTHERIAEVVGRLVDFLSLVERGRKAPSFETLDRIAKRLRMSVADLFRFEQ